MNDFLKKAIPAAAMALFAGLAFAGTPNAVKFQGTGAYGGTVSQADPAPDCKKDPTDPRCKPK